MNFGISWFRMCDGSQCLFGSHSNFGSQIILGLNEHYGSQCLLGFHYEIDSQYITGFHVEECSQSVLNNGSQIITDCSLLIRKVLVHISYFSLQTIYGIH